MLGHDHKILAQAAPPGGSLYLLYTVPEDKMGTIKLIVCNQHIGPDAYRFAVVPSGGEAFPEHYLAYDFPVVGNDSLISTAFTLQAGTSVWVQSTNGSMSFTLTGILE